MAVKGTEVQILRNGIEAQKKSRGSFGLNVFYRDQMLNVRKGFGQMAQFDTTMSRNITGAAVEWGYKKHLGSYVMRTNFGHRQIISVFSAHVNTGNYVDRSKETDLYIVSIYDETTGDRWEEPLTRRTSEGSETISPMPTRYGTYETALDRDKQAWQAVITEGTFYFEEYADFLFFGNTDTGMMAYVPSVFTARPFDKMVEAVTLYAGNLKGESESATIIKALPTDGDFSEAYAYLTSTEFPNPTDVTNVKGRMVFAVDRTVFFSDVDRPTAIIDANFITVPSEGDIVAIEEQNGNLIIWTGNQTWLYRLSDGAIASAGRLQRLSNHVGCVSPNSVTKVEGAIIWVDTNGVFLSPGDFTVQEISQSIRPFFQSFITNPLTHYFSQAGATDMVSQQPNTTYKFNPAGINATYSPFLDVVLITVPNENIALCWSGNQWTVWSFDSTVYLNGSSASAPGIQRNIENPWVVADQDDVFLLGSTDDQALVDESQLAGTTDVDDDTTSRSYFLCRYGRGGALDRSVDDEDFRTVAAKYKRDDLSNTASDEQVFYIDRWIDVPVGFTFSGGTVATANTFFLPITAVIPTTLADGPDKFDLIFRFDNSKFEPIFNGGGSTEIDFYLPNKRIDSLLGYSPGGPIAGTSEVQCYSAGVASATGNEIRIRWDGATGGSTWVHAPYMNLAHQKKEPIIFIPMRMKTSVSTFDLSSMGLDPQSAVVQDVIRAITQSDTMIYWEQWTTSSLRGEDSIAQPVDWAYKADEIGADEGQTFKARGMYVRLMSHGSSPASNRLFPQWQYGPFNTLLAADFKNWMSQLIDFEHDPASLVRIAKATNIRTRILDSNGILRFKMFDNDLRYGDPATPATGNLLIDDEEVSEIATSDSVKGSSFAYMVFGFMQDKAEEIKLEDIKAVLRQVGGRRRRGRGTRVIFQSESES